MSPRLKKAISYIIPPIITVGLCLILYSDIDMAMIADGLAQCNYLLVAAFLLCNLGAMLIRALRWRLQLRAIGVNPPLGVMNRSIFGTYAVNLVFPRLGEFWRCGYIARVQSAPFSSVFGTMVADRLSDTLMVLLISIPTFAASSTALNRFLAKANVGASVGDILLSWPMLVAGVCLVGVLVWILRSGSAPARKIREFLLNTWRGFAVIFKMPRRGLWMLFTLGIWGCYIVSMAFSLASFAPTAGLVASDGVLTVMITFVFGSLAMAIPSNGGIGPWQFAIILSLSGLFGLDQQQALVFATLNLAASTIMTIVLGIISFVHIAVKRK